MLTLYTRNTESQSTSARSSGLEGVAVNPLDWSIDQLRGMRGLGGC
jgi:hypothetical protein